MEKAIECITQKYADFSGRASRSEYWLFALFLFLANILFGIIDLVIGFNNKELSFGLLGGFFSLATIVPCLSVATRRLHDINKSGWWQLISIIPLIGGILMLIWTCTKGTEGSNDYGANPL